MDTKAKKDAIATGQNVDLDNVIVLNDVRVSKEKAPSGEEEKNVETTPDASVKTDVAASEQIPVQEGPKVEAIPVPKIDIPTEEPQVSVSGEIPTIGQSIPTPTDNVVPPIQFPTPQDNTSNYDNPLPFNLPETQDNNGIGNAFNDSDSYDNPLSFQPGYVENQRYDSHENNYPGIPVDVKGSLDMLGNRFAAITDECEELRRKCEQLESRFDAAQQEIMRLRQENAAYEESMNRARASILENFGLSDKKFGNYHDTPSDNSFGGMNRAA